MRALIAARTLAAAVLFGLLQCGNTMGAGPVIYKHVDEKGNVVYSEVPPTGGKDVKKLDARPAYEGRGANIDAGNMHRGYRRSPEDYRRQYKNAYERHRQQVEAMRKKSIETIEDECNRNHGTDCSNPDTLRYIESTKVPRRY